MYAINKIKEYLSDISAYFYDIYIEVNSWIRPFRYTAYPFYKLSYYFAKLAWQFYYFGQWCDDVADKVSKIVSLSNIYSYFKSYFTKAVDAWNWVRYAPYNVKSIINSWWHSVKYTVLSWIADIKSWSLAQLNSLEATFVNLISSVQNWTLTQISNTRSAFLALITDVKSWTFTQINNARTAILGALSSLEQWTQTQINTIKATLAALTDWATFYTWLANWWKDKLLDIQNLLNTAFILRSAYWAGWQEMRAQVTEFFTDPGKWFMDRIEKWIEDRW